MSKKIKYKYSKVKRDKQQLVKLALQSNVLLVSIILECEMYCIVHVKFFFNVEYL